MVEHRRHHAASKPLDLGEVVMTTRRTTSRLDGSGLGVQLPVKKKCKGESVCTIPLRPGNNKSIDYFLEAKVRKEIDLRIPSDTGTQRRKRDAVKLEEKP